MDLSYLNPVQGETEDLQDSHDSDNIPLSQRKRKSDTEAGTSSVPSGAQHESSPKRAKLSTAGTISADMGVSVETAQAYIDENNAVLLTQETASKDSLLVHKILKDIGNLDTQIEQLTRFNPKPVTNNALHRLDMARFKDVQTRRACPDPILRVRASKPKRDPMLTILITRQGGPDSPAAVYTEVLQARELARLGFSEWEQILSLVSKQKSKAAAEVKVAIEKLMERVRGIGLIPPEDKSQRKRSTAAGPSAQVQSSQSTVDSYSHMEPRSSIILFQQELNPCSINSFHSLSAGSSTSMAKTCVFKERKNWPRHPLNISQICATTACTTLPWRKDSTT